VENQSNVCERIQESEIQMTDLTPDQLEAAAREYCRIASLEPDEVFAMHAFQPRWRLIAAEINKHHLMNECIELAKEQKL
jgi:hypothetical protein